MTKLSVAAAVLMLLVVPTMGQAGVVLDEVRSRGFVRCSVDDTPGFGAVGPDGRRQGMDVDFCRAVTAAVIGDPDAVELLRITTANKFAALAAGEIDIALGMTTWTLTRDARLQADFAGVMFYDGQGFLAWADTGADSLSDLSGARICVQEGTTSAANVADYTNANGLSLTPVLLASSDERRDAFMRRVCEVTTGDRSALATTRANLGRPIQSALIMLPEVISREPLGPVVREGDDEWLDIVRWTLFTLIQAEDLGIDQASVLSGEFPDDAESRRILGIDGDLGVALDLDPDWARRILASVGNYGDMFERHLGTASPLGLDRGLNRSWRHGGLLYAPAFR